jgi:glucosylceramidase
VGGGSTGGTTGSGGSGTGGATGSGGSGTGGTTGTGGSGTGGTTGSGGSGTGGATGTGGTGTTNQPLVVTSANNAFWKTNGTLTTSTANATVTVNDTTVKQNWEGFGGAFNELGWSYIQMLSASDQTKVMDLLFGTDAAHFAIGRIPIGASDYALSRYTDDETSGDTSLNSFSITEDMKYLIPYVQAAQKVNSGLRFWASPWTPPTWMKTFTGNDSNGTACKLVGSTNFDGGCMNATSANLTAFANYLSKWVTAYNGLQIKIDTISPQNEPNYAQGYPSCLWNTADYVTFFKGALTTAFPSSGSTKVMLGTMSNGDNGASSFDLKVVQAVEADSTAKTIPKVMGLQWGMLDLYNGLTSGIGPSNFMTGSLPVWATEHKCGNYPWITNTSTSNPATGTNFPAYAATAPNDQAYGVESWAYIRNAINKGGVTAYNAWNMVLDTVGKGNDTTRAWAQDALLVVNTSSKTLTVTPAYYVFRHCSQYVQVGATVVTTTGGDAIAWKNPDGSEVAVMYNSGSASTYTIAIAGKKMQFAMPAAGWATVYIPAS